MIICESVKRISVHTEEIRPIQLDQDFEREVF